MANVISITSGKGGTGKSSVTSGIAAAFADREQKALIMELDIGLRCIDLLFGVSGEVRYDLGMVLTGQCTPQQAIVPIPSHPGLDYLAAPSVMPEQFDFKATKQCIQTLKPAYDVILLDTPAGLGLSILSTVQLSDLAIIVATPDPASIRDGARVAMLLEERGFQNYKILINKVSRAALKKSSVRDLDDVLEGIGAPLLGVLPEDSSYRIAMANGETLPPHSIISLVYEAIVRRLEGEEVPLVLTRLPFI